VAAPLRKSSGRPVFPGFTPSLSRSWGRSIVTRSSSSFVWMLPLASKKVSGISLGDQILARGEKKRTLLIVFPPPIWEAVFDHKDANLEEDRGGSAEVGYGSDGSENAVRTDEGGFKLVCCLSPSPVFSVFCLFPMSMGSSGMEDSGTMGISSGEMKP